MPICVANWETQGGRCTWRSSPGRWLGARCRFDRCKLVEEPFNQKLFQVAITVNNANQVKCHSVTESRKEELFQIHHRPETGVASHCGRKPADRFPVVRRVKL